MDLVQIIAQYGFPIAVAVYVLVELNKSIKRFEKTLDRNTVAICLTLQMLQIVAKNLKQDGNDMAAVIEKKIQDLVNPKDEVKDA